MHIAFSLYVQKTVLYDTPVSGDESSMVFQGQLFANGELFHENSSPQTEGVFKRHHVVLTNKKEYSKYPPGMALLFAAAIKLHNSDASLVNLFLSLISFLLFALLGWRITKSPLFVFLLSLQYLFATTLHFHAASWFSHNAPLLGALILALILTLPREKHYCSAVVGGILLFFRPFDAILLLGSFGIASLLSTTTDFKSYKSYKVYGIMIPLFLFFVILFLGYHYIYTGDPLLSPYAIYQYGGTLKTGSKIGEIQLRHGYFSNGLMSLTPLWLHTQLRWSNLFLPLILVAPFLWRKWASKKEKPIILFAGIVILAYIFGYAVHNSSGGDSFGARYYIPSIWAWFLLVAFVVSTLIKSLQRRGKTVVITLFVVVVSGWFIYDFPAKSAGVREKVRERLQLFKDAEKHIQPNEKAVILIQNPITMDGPWYVRSNPFEEKHIVYGGYPWKKPELISTVAEVYPDHTVYILNYVKGKAHWKQP